MYALRFLRAVLAGLLVCVVGHAQTGLTLIEDSTMVAETAIYEDEEGNLWADLVKVQFVGHVVDVPPGTETFSRSAVTTSFPAVSAMLAELEVNEGLTQLEKVIPTAVYGDTLRPNVRTGTLVPIPEYSQLVNLRFASPVPTDSIATLMATLDAVRYAEGPFIDYLLGEPNDFNYAAQWQLQRVNAPWAWDLTRGDEGGEPVRIAIPDSFPCKNTAGFRLHMDLRGRLTMRTDCSTTPAAGSSHGVSVAGVAGAETNNGWQPVTMASDTGEYPHPSGDSTGSASLGWNVLLNGYATTSSGFIEAVLDLGSAFSFRVINASFSGGGDAMEEAVKAFLRADVIVVGAAGNAATFPRVFYPAGYTWMDFGFDGQQPDLIGKQVIAVAGTDRDDTTIPCWNYSPCGDPGQPPCDPLNPAPMDSSFVDVAAPAFGTDNGSCESTFNTSVYTLYSELLSTDETYLTSNGDRIGTSFASPMVAAATALILSINPDLGPREVYEAITKSAEKVDQTGAGYIALTNGARWSKRLGYGQLDAYGALKYAIQKWGGTLGGVGDTLTFHEDFDLADNVEIAFRAGTTVRFAPGVSLSADKITAVGTSADSVRFVPLYDLAQHPDSTWTGLIITGSESFVSHAVLEGAEVAIDLRGIELTVDRTFFSGNGTALLTDYTYCPAACIPSRSSFSLSNSRIESGTGVAIHARHSEGVIFGTTITGNESHGLLAQDADLYPFNDNVFTGNGFGTSSSVPGIALLSGGDVTMASAGYGLGLNHIHDNARHQVRLFAGAATHIGGNGIGGDNAIYRAGGPAGGARYIHNGTGQEVYAHYVYWGTPGSVPSGAFFGPVEADHPLQCFPPASCLAGPAPTSFGGDIYARSGNATPERLPSSAAAGHEVDWREWLGPEIREIRHVLASNPGEAGNTERALHLAHLQRLDREDELGEYAATWLQLGALRRLLDSGTTGNLHAVASAALRVEVQEALRREEFPEARTLLAHYGPLVVNEADRLALDLSAVALDEMGGDYLDALDRLQNLIAAAREEELRESLALVVQAVQRHLEVEGAPGSSPPSNAAAAGIPSRFELAHAYPNPFNPRATIPFALPEAARVTLTVYDVLGRQIAILADGRFEAGRHTAALDGSLLASGLYLVRAVIEPEGGSAALAFTQRLTLLK